VVAATPLVHWSADRAFDVGVEARQAARHADRLGEPFSGQLVAVVGLQCFFPYMGGQRRRLRRVGQAERNFQAQHAGRAQLQRVGFQGWRDQRHARMLALGQANAGGIDHHPFAIVDLLGHQPGGSHAWLPQRHAAAGFDRIKDDLGQDRHGRAARSDENLSIIRSDASRRWPSLFLGLGDLGRTRRAARPACALGFAASALAGLALAGLAFADFAFAGLALAGLALAAGAASPAAGAVLTGAGAGSAATSGAAA
jgi:hypothetical protein